MLVSKVLSESGTEALLKERVADYEQRALDYLKTTFPDHHKLHGVNTELALIRSTYGTAKRRGIKRIRDHLQYLALTVYLGAGFERNPAHFHQVRRAGWFSSNGTAQRVSSFDLLFAWAERWQELTDLDVNPPPTQTLQEEMQRNSAWSDERAIYESLWAVWPNRAMALPPNSLMEFTRKTLAYANSLSLPSDESLVWCVVALHLGSQFPQDPRYQDLAKKMHPNSDAPRPTSETVIADLKEVFQ